MYFVSFRKLLLDFSWNLSIYDPCMCWTSFIIWVHFQSTYTERQILGEVIPDSVYNLFIVVFFRHLVINQQIIQSCVNLICMSWSWRKLGLYILQLKNSARAVTFSVCDSALHADVINFYNNLFLALIFILVFFHCAVLQS